MNNLRLSRKAVILLFVVTVLLWSLFDPLSIGRAMAIVDLDNQIANSQKINTIDLAEVGPGVHASIFGSSTIYLHMHDKTNRFVVVPADMLQNEIFRLKQAGIHVFNVDMATGIYLWPMLLVSLIALVLELCCHRQFMFRGKCSS
jgi:hypothetical protein